MKSTTPTAEAAGEVVGGNDEIAQRRGGLARVRAERQRPGSAGLPFLHEIRIRAVARLVCARRRAPRASPACRRSDCMAAAAENIHLMLVRRSRLTVPSSS